MEDHVEQVFNNRPYG